MDTVSEENAHDILYGKSGFDAACISSALFLFALNRFKARIAFANHKNPAVTTHDLAVFMAFSGRSQRVKHLHFHSLLTKKAAKALVKAVRAAFFGKLFLFAGVVSMGSRRDVQCYIRQRFTVQLDCAVGFNGRADDKKGVGAGVVKSDSAVSRMDCLFHKIP